MSDWSFLRCKIAPEDVSKVVVDGHIWVEDKTKPNGLIRLSADVESPKPEPELASSQEKAKVSTDEKVDVKK